MFINPVAFHIGSWPIHWYGILYLVGFAGCWLLLAYRARQSFRGFTVENVSDFVFWGAVGAVMGGRFGYVIFYELDPFLDYPWVIFKVWEGGMSFHGGLLGVIISLWVYAKMTGYPFLRVTDFVAPAVPFGLFAGRMGNFINGELWGRATELPWGMVFPRAGDLPRHPSSLYEAGLEGIVLFIILWLFSMKPRPRGAVSGLFLTGYGLFRFLVEWVREPDSHMGFVALGWMTEGQLLSLPMILIGLMMLIGSYHHSSKKTA